MSLVGKHILLGVTGGIAAYKSADLTRRLTDAGAEVRVTMTRAATKFVAPLTFQALSGNPVHTKLLDPAAEAAMGHIELARWADAVLVAPASADFMARIAHGLADDLLTTLCLATEAPIVLAPAMNRVMWSNRATQHNADILKARGISLFGPGEGYQACGEVGAGRMLEPTDLVGALTGLFNRAYLEGVHLLITAGPTREAMDPVRYITNRSSGKMGFALAQAARDAGAHVKLVTGPVALATPRDVVRVDVETALDMRDAVMREISGVQIFIACAAVADYRPLQSATQKIKKTHDRIALELTKNPDIVTEVASLESPPYILGFAAETQELAKNAKSKLESKRLDMIAANRVDRSDIGFESEYNALTVIWPGGQRSLSKATKSELARQLIELLAQHYGNSRKKTRILQYPETQGRSQDSG